MKILAWPLLLLALSACQHVPGDRQETTVVPPPAHESGAEARSSETGARLELPATFVGTLPCADCPGIRTQLALWPNGVYQLRRDWLERDFGLSGLGRWRHDPRQGVLVLDGADDTPLRFEIKGPRVIRQLDGEGRPIVSGLPYDLRSDGVLHAFTSRLDGMFSYMADAPRFSACGSSQGWPVAMEGAYIDLERAYLARPQPSPGAPWPVTLEARIEERAAMEGDSMVPTLVVEHFVGEADDSACPPAGGDATLAETYWRVLELAGEPAVVVEDHQEAHLILRGGDARFAATAGCNRFAGHWEVDGDHIRFGNAASTMMACWPPLDAQERRLGSVLVEAAQWRIHGQTLEFKDADGNTIALFEAVYLR